MIKSRVQVIVDELDRERFRRQAEAAGMSLSSWLRQAGREKAAAESERERLRTVEELRAFFAATVQREDATGEREPEWSEHRAVIERSLRSGAAET